MKTSPGGRYDLAALRPPEPDAGIHTPDADAVQTLQTLQRWCLAGSGPGGSPWWRLRALPTVEKRLSVAHLNQTSFTDDHAVQRLAAQLMLERDGSLQLQACRTLAGRLLLRLKTKAHDLMWWRRREPGDAWDSGYLRDGANGLQAMKQFLPRRATLLVVDCLEDGLTDAALVALSLDLQARQHSFAHPVRLLVLGPLPAALKADGATAVITSSAH